ncbi:transient receptor potential protein-like [Neocloeon triangulifer]|uniref:transient receptor potential protein-like n=1 Tax=Neocloeon triangulifer TaxID=2078957 RepID=UPI00286EEA62|nr:transient receptor potential protein-like [Neocloeon triangulifer]
MASTSSTEHLVKQQRPSVWTLNQTVVDVPLSAVEKKFLLLVERGDVASAKRHIEEHTGKPDFSIDCVDPMGRSALFSAVDNENLDMIQLLLESGIKMKDALLEAIREQYVEGVEALLEWEESIHKQGELYSWEAVDRSQAKFTPDITPLMLAAHMDNFEIIRMLLDRGATVPSPHDIKCSCEECVLSVESDSLRHSLARINAYKALSSPSLIVLSSKDPLLTAFELSHELSKLRKLESEFSEEYKEMRVKVNEFTGCLLDFTREQKELEVVLNHCPETGWDPRNKYSLERLKLAVKYKQKAFVGHPHVQQLLGAIWYDGLPGFKRLGQLQQLFTVLKMFILFPYYCTVYMLAPNSKAGQFVTKPFVKFVCHKASYLYFLMMLCAASQRIEYIVLKVLGMFIDPYFQEVLDDWNRRERGAWPGLFESACVVFIFGNIFAELRQLWEDGLFVYMEDMWNIADLASNTFYVTWIAVRADAIFCRLREQWNGWDPYYPREKWDPFDPDLLAEGMFAAGMIFSVLKLVHIFSINPHLGPLQISLGRMIIDIIKFFFIYTLVLFAFGCGMNQLLWYYSELEMHRCYNTDDPFHANFHDEEKACSVWRRFYNLFETSQSMFWASFGLVDLISFDLTGIKSFTRFWALLMFGSYSVINVIVLLNMLIAMMSNSFQLISERSDLEWKFARSKLWISYFDIEQDILPPPFNMCPSPGLFRDIFGVGKPRTTASFKFKTIEKTQERHDTVMKLLVKRYISTEQQRREEEIGISQDDVVEVRQDISSLRYELVDIFRNNGYKTPQIDQSDIGSKKAKQIERRLMKDFTIGCVEGALDEAAKSAKGAKDIFSKLAKAIGKKGSKTSLGSKTQLGSRADAFGRKKKPTDATGSSAALSESRQSLRRLHLDPEELKKQFPKLEAETKTTQLAFAKFSRGKIRARDKLAVVDETAKETAPKPPARAPPKPSAAPVASGALGIKERVARQISLENKKEEEEKSKMEPTMVKPSEMKGKDSLTSPPPAAPTPAAPPAPPKEAPAPAKEPEKPEAPKAPEKPAEKPAATTQPPAAKPKPAAAAPAPKPSTASHLHTPVPTGGKSVISGRHLDGWL